MSSHYALITGASSGIGAAMARLLAKEGRPLILTARRGDRLDNLAAELRRPDLPVHVLPGDLRERDWPRRLYERCRTEGWVVGTLIANAGFGSWGPLWNLDADNELDMVEVNLRSTVALTRLFLPEMIRKRSGGILIVASTAGFQPIPYFSTYSASKAFLISFAESMAREAEDFGVRVTCLCPSGTRTEFFHVSGLENPGMPVESFKSAEEVAVAGLWGLEHGKQLVVLGGWNRVMIWLSRFVPRSFVSARTKTMFRPLVVEPPEKE